MKYLSAFFSRTLTSWNLGFVLSTIENMRYEHRYLKFLERVSNNLKKYRKEAGLTQERLSESIGFSTRYYQNLESGRQSPNLVTLYKVCVHLKIDIALLFE